MSLAQTATWEARQRLDAGEDEGTVIREIVGSTVRAYLLTPWTCWHPHLRMFLTHGEAVNVNCVRWQEEKTRRK